MNKNKEKLTSFTAYCEAHPEERFFQALLNWGKTPEGKQIHFIYVESSDNPLRDTFYWE